MIIQPCIQATPIINPMEVEVMTCKNKCSQHPVRFAPNFCQDCGGKIGKHKTTIDNPVGYTQLFEDPNSMHEVFSGEYIFLFARRNKYEMPQEEYHNVTLVSINGSMEAIEGFKRRHRKEIEIIRQASGGNYSLRFGFVNNEFIDHWN